MSKGIYSIILIYLSIALIKTQENPDVVKDIPGFPYKGRMFSGYLEINDPLKRYHYLLVEAATEADTRPLILWLNGGPGCSSMSGFITEIGPATFPDHEFELKTNPYSWHKLANMLFLESPGNVGFSRIDSQLEEELYIDDALTAQENMEALLDFFKKYSRFKSRDFYISGESYAGIYIPELAKKVLDYNKDLPSSEKIRFKGFLVGNGVASWHYDTDPAKWDFAFSHHLYSYETRKQFNEVCINHPDEAKCEAIKDQIDDECLKDINIYDYLQECYMPDESEMSPEEYKKSFYYMYAPWAFRRNRKSKNKHRNFLSFIEEDEPKKRKNEYAPPCMDLRASTEFLNRPEVQRALHVDSVEWTTCAESVAQRYIRDEDGSLPLYPELVKSGLKILIFSGDTDMSVPYNGNQKWIDGLNLEVKSPWRSWRHPEDDLNVAGYRQIYDGLTFVTFKGTGHMAVQWKAKEAFYMLQQYLNDKDL